MESKPKRKYYSQRNGKTDTKIELNTFKDIFYSLYQELDLGGYFQEHLGYECVDQGFVAGQAGQNVESYVMRKVRKNNLWPIGSVYEFYSEEDIFDVIEFLFDNISRPLESNAYYHSFAQCGYHFKDFDQYKGQLDFRNKINEYLNDYGDGYELSENGEILSLLSPEFKPLLEANLPTNDPENVEVKVQNAVNKYRRYGSTIEDRKDAVRDLVDCLEFLRPEIEKVLSNKDEADLFNIANNFGIRHHNDKQKNNYDRNIWLSWMFYFYLSTIHACLRLINKKIPSKAK